jgi:hypothetical protein
MFLSASDVVMLLGLLALAVWLLSLREEDPPARPAPACPGVEVLEPRECPSVPAPTYHGGSELAHVEVNDVFLGSAWSGLGAERGAIDAAMASLASGANAASWAPFGPGAGRLASSSLLAGLSLGNSVSDREVQLALKLALFFGKVPPPGPDSLYVVVLPPGVGVGMSGAAAYHGSLAYLGGQVSYAVVPAQVDPAYTVVLLSHELDEAVLDPMPLTGWNAGTATTEPADLAGGANQLLGGQEVAAVIGPYGKPVPVTPGSGNLNSAAGLPGLKPPSYGLAALVLAADWQAAGGNPTTFVEYALAGVWLATPG